MKIIIAADHGGDYFIQGIDAFLQKQGHHTVVLRSDDPADDYPDVVQQAAQLFQSHNAERMVLLCGSGTGIMMSANTVPGLRAFWPRDPEMTAFARQHNDANVICFGGRIHTIQQIEACLTAFTGTSFEGGRHARRIAKLEQQKKGTAHV